jgi:hypothetical protein
MPGVQETLVDAVVAYLDGLTFSQSITLEKKLVPNFAREDLEGFTVSVYAGPSSREKANRSGVFIITWGVGIVVRCSAEGSAEELEAKAGQFLELCEELQAALQTQHMDGIVPSEIQMDVPYDQSKVSDMATFFTQFIVNYKQ